MASMVLPAEVDLLAASVLAARASPEPDFRRESEALDRLIGRINERPDRAYDALTLVTAELCGAGSAGVSILENDRFNWPAIAGAWAAYAGHGMPLDASPCGIVISRDEPLLFEQPQLIFPDVTATPLIQEVLLVPLRIGGTPFGTLWALSHDERRFTAEDARILDRLGMFAAAHEEVMRRRTRGDAAVAERARVRHTMAVIRSIVRRAGEDATEAETQRVIGECGERIASYARAAHPAGGEALDLYGLLADMLVRHGEQPGDRVTLDGPDARIAAAHAGTIALAVHELLDNAYRHGALARPGGAVRVGWSVRRERDRDWAELRWRESGVAPGPATEPAQGFGFDLLLSGLPAQTGGSCEIVLPADGLSATLLLPLR